MTCCGLTLTTGGAGVSLPEERVTLSAAISVKCSTIGMRTIFLEGEREMKRDRERMREGK